ncbi:SpoIIE family protein phosphatase [Streptomyces sp. B1866]|uniref:SpoIIE family protein phosphatase n=1 Tax=Streptomyces sp. B1866 TaxID=3075431 RepID=UPI00289090AD|nr:SpoIIE family protein phosphatase [Streptomyces sp. B1866]MDT3395067.1 SpoIIE family protein phosphatase [Streptomyces sp. B1866]
MDARRQHDAQGAQDSPGPVRADRLRMLAAVDESRGDTGVLLAALQHLTTELGGLGGMAHLRLKDFPRGVLRMVAGSGLPEGFTRAWEAIADGGSSAPARAAREGGVVWVAEVGVPEQAAGKPAVRPEDSGVPAGAGLAAVALPRAEGPLGALSVVTPPSARAPDAGQRAFLVDVARWTGGRLRMATPRPEGLSTAMVTEARGEEGAVAAYDWDLRAGRLTIDEMWLAQLRIDRKGTDWAETWGDLLHPDDWAYMLRGNEAAIRAGGSYDGEYRVRRADGGYAWVRDRGEVVRDEAGRPVRMVGTLRDTSRAHAALESVGRALRHMSDGFLSVSGTWRVEFVNVTAQLLLAAPRGLVGRRLWDVPAVRRVAGLRERCERAVADGEPTGFDVRWPDSERWYHLRLVPVPDGGLALYIADITERRLREAAERAAAERAALMARLTRALSEAVTAHDVVEAVAGSVLPPFGATGLIVAVLEHDRLNVVGSTGYPRSFIERVHGTPLPSAATGDALRARAPEFIESVEDFLVRHPQRADLAGAGGKQAAAFLPLIASGRPIGMCVITFDDPRPFGEDERTVLTALSGLVAQALERASLYDAATARARDLQRALLPRALPSLPALTAAARYLPAGRGADVGGDWYDVIPLSADRVALVIGDVMGHGMSEAATMGRLRTAVRTLSDLELPPGEILARLDDVVADLGEDRFATCLYGIYDPVTGRFAHASAGHPPPATVRPDGAVAFPTPVPDLPLGAAAPPYETAETRLPDGSLLVLYTDGLVESRHRDIDDGMDLLARVLRTGRGGGVDALCDEVTAALLPADQPIGDDAALLVARVHRFAPDAVASWPLPQEPVAARRARELVRAQLAAWRLEELETTTELIASELVGNVIRHARGPMALRLLRSRTLTCEVSDASLTTPHIRQPALTDEGGRGLRLVAAMAGRWGTRFTPTGKCIWTEQPLPAGAPGPVRAGEREPR